MTDGSALELGSQLVLQTVGLHDEVPLGLADGLGVVPSVGGGVPGVRVAWCEVGEQASAEASHDLPGRIGE